MCYRLTHLFILYKSTIARQFTARDKGLRGSGERVSSATAPGSRV